MGIKSLRGQSTKQKENLLPLSFQDEKSQGSVFDWYRDLKEKSPNVIAIDTLEIRMDTSGAVPHRFVMLYMRDHSVHRLDQRPNHHLDGDEILRNLDEGTVEEIRRKTKREIELALKGKVDLNVVLSVCVVISRDDRTKNIRKKPPFLI
ncbi:hypothetical protein B0H16DRAFT_1345967 [Mycena metata]|uniref:Uncharacterized protein n=1 Tax=Mycena metata TaxID=1033252 RepID=A0AAD7GUV0_9AGAR|nr:hypothetical protein B0H16DRAFT_1345967 [Mycena metata]